MQCFLCGKKIGFVRSLTDQQYCSPEHRREARLASAQALREEDDLESWAVARARRKNQKKEKNTSPASQAGAVLAFVAIGGAMVAVLVLGGGAPKTSGGAAFPMVSTETGKKPGMLEQAGNSLSDLIRGAAPITLERKFSGGNLFNSTAIPDWANVQLRASTIDDPRDWIGKSKNSPSSLRLWKKSTTMQNYQMEFQAQLEKTSLSWAIRASDGGNFYATKLAIIKPGPLPNAGLIRYAVINGKEVDKTQVPLPITLERGVDYRIRVTVQDDQFLTYINGKWIGKMTDKRLSRGGIGFFDDSGDPQKVAWVSVSERDSFLGRLLSHFAMFVIPGEPLN
jgi:hypothetical protein